MRNSENLYRRKAVAQAIDRFYYEAGNSARCHKKTHERFGKYICAVNYETFMDYLKVEIPEEYELPQYIVDGLRCMVFASEKYPFPFEEDEALEFIGEFAEEAL